MFCFVWDTFLLSWCHIKESQTFMYEVLSLWCPPSLETVVLVYCKLLEVLFWTSNTKNMVKLSTPASDNKNILHVLFEGCDNHKYGLMCNQTCGSCYGGKQCDHVNGSCTDGCEAGLFGEKCDEGWIYSLIAHISTITLYAFTWQILKTRIT